MTAAEVLANDAYGTLAAGASAVAQGTVQSWAMTSSNLPSCTAGTGQFRLVDQAPAASAEIILVTVSTGGTALSVARGAENTTPVAHAPGAVFALTITAGVLANITGISGPSIDVRNPAYAGGAACNGLAGYYGQATQGSPTFTDPTASFTAALNGQTFTMPTTGGVWTGSITYVNATTLTISASAPANSQVAAGTTGAITEGQANLTDSGASFAQAWDGAIVTIQGAGAAGAALQGQLQAVSSATSLWLCQLTNTSAAVYAGTTVTGAVYTINLGRYYTATDDTAAWEAAISAAAAAGIGEITWNGVSCVSATLNFPDNIRIRGSNMSPVRPVVGSPTRGSVLRAHGTLSGTLATFGPGSYGYAESQIAAGAASCDFDGAGVSAWCVISQGNMNYFDHCWAGGGTSGCWQATEGETIWNQCTGAGIGEGDALFVNAANDCQWNGGFLYGGANQVHIRNTADFKMTGAHPYCGYDDSDTAVGHITCLIDTTGIGGTQNIAFDGVDFDNSYGPHIRIAPAAGTTISEINITGCQFYQNPGPYITWPNTTYPVVQVDTTAGAGALVSRVNITGGSAVSNWTGSVYKSILDVDQGGGSGLGVLKISDFTATYCAAILSGTAPSHQWLSNVAAYTGSTWLIQGNVAEAGISPVAAGWTSFGVGGAVNPFNSSLGTAKAPAAAGEWYIGALLVPYNCTLTGVLAYALSTGGTDDWIFALWNSSGTLLAHSTTSGTIAPSAGTRAKFPFTATVNVTGPAMYFIGLQSSGTTAEFPADGNAADGFPSGTQSGSFGTVPVLSPVPSSFTGTTAPLVSTY